MNVSSNRIVTVEIVILFFIQGLLIFSGLFSTMIFFPSSANAPTTVSAYSSYALANLESDDRLNLSQLLLLTGGQTTVSKFEQVIGQMLLPYNIREILLDIGWQNYSVGSIPFENWVNNWLTASDELGIQNVIYVGQLTASGIGSPWIESLIRSDPSTQTFYSNGQPANYVSPDDPDVARAIEMDLATLYSYYGAHKSWTGIGTGYSSEDPYYSSDSTMPITGYSNSTVEQFVSSVYYQRDVNGSGFASNGTQDLLYSEYDTVEPSIVLASGPWMLSSSENVYGSGSNEFSMSMEFAIPKNESEIEILWYGQSTGHPGPLEISISRAGTNGQSVANNTISNQTQSASTIANNTRWQGPVVFNGNFSAGYYWIDFSSPTSNAQNCYTLYFRDYPISNAEAFYTGTMAGFGTVQGTTILWVKDAQNNSLEIYPFQQAVVSQAPLQTFVATSSLSFNTVFLFVSDREYNEVNGTISILDETEGNLTVDSGILSQSLTHGIQNWLPISLNSTLTTIQGHEYLIKIEEPNAGYSWRVILRGLYVSPAEAGFQNQSQFMLFRLGLMNFTISHVDFGGVTVGDAISDGDLVAVRFEPSMNEMINSFSILMKKTTQTGTYYNSSSSLSFALWSNSNNGPSGSEPAGPLLQNIVLPGSIVPQNGWLNVTGFNETLQAGEYYWMVLSTNSSTSFTIARLASPYAFLVQVSDNNGSTWHDANQGPTEYSFAINLSGEEIGNFIQDIPEVKLNGSTIFAEPIVANTSIQVKGVYLGVLGVIQSLGPASGFLVSINPSQGNGDPSNLELASGTIYSDNITYITLDYVQFTSVARLEAGQKYWIVVQSTDGINAVYPVEYSQTPKDVPENYTALISFNKGFSWSNVSDFTTILSYKIASPVLNESPTYDTSELFIDLSENHDFPTQTGELRGWNAYIQTQELNTYEEITSWFDNYTGRNWVFYSNATRNIVEASGYQNIAISPVESSAFNCSSFVNNVVSGMIGEGNQFFNVDYSTLHNCESQKVQSLVTDLNQIKYLGNHFGSNDNDEVLVVGQGSNSNLTGFLSSLFNATYDDLQYNNSLPTLTSADKISTVVWSSTAGTPTDQEIANLQNYVATGGNLLVLNSSSTWIHGIIAQSGSLNQTNFITPSLAREVIGNVTVHTPYYEHISISSESSRSVLASGNGFGIEINLLGAGRIALINSSQSPVLIQVSESFTLLSNLISTLDSSSVGSVWYENASLPSSVQYSILGNSGGPLLLLISNPSASYANLGLFLNTKYFGMGENWSLFDPITEDVSFGNSSVVPIKITLEPQSWTAEYIIPNPLENLILYTNMLAIKQLTYPNQFLYSLQGVENQSGIVAVLSKTPILDVQLDGSYLTKLNNTIALLDGKSGWFYDNQTGTLYINYVSQGIDSVRVILSIPSIQSGYSPSLDLILIGLPGEVCIAVYVVIRRYGKR